MDVIALAQAGFGEAVAPLGTALTEAQLERLWRLSDVPILCFDGDSAGQKAAMRAAQPRAADARARPQPRFRHAARRRGSRRSGPHEGPGRVRGTARARPSRWSIASGRTSWPPNRSNTPEQKAGLKMRLNELAQSIADMNVQR